MLRTFLNRLKGANNNSVTIKIQISGSLTLLTTGLIAGLLLVWLTPL